MGIEMHKVGRRVRVRYTQTKRYGVIARITGNKAFPLRIRFDDDINGHLVSFAFEEVDPLCAHCGRPPEEHASVTWKCLFGASAWE